MAFCIQYLQCTLLSSDSVDFFVRSLVVPSYRHTLTPSPYYHIVILWRSLCGPPVSCECSLRERDRGCSWSITREHLLLCFFFATLYMHSVLALCPLSLIQKPSLSPHSCPFIDSRSLCPSLCVYGLTLPTHRSTSGIPWTPHSDGLSVGLCLCLSVDILVVDRAVSPCDFQ